MQKWRLTSGIASLKTIAGMRKEKYVKIFTELEAVAKVQSIKSSNAIEGIVTSDERIAAIVNQNSAPLNHNEAEIAGYRDALNEIHLGYEFGGQYKTDDNVILEMDGRKIVVCVFVLPLRRTRQRQWNN